MTEVEAIKSKLTIVDVVGSYLKLEKAGINYKARCPFHNERTPSFFVSPERGSFHCFGCAKGGDMFTFVEEIEGLEFREALKVLAERAGVNLELRAPNGDRSSASSGATGKLREALSTATKFYQSELTKSTTALAYLTSRGVSDESIAKFRIGFAPLGWRNLANYLKKQKINEADGLGAGLLIKSEKNSQDYYDRFRERIMFPFTDFSGRVIGFSGRILPGSADEATMGPSTGSGQAKYVNSPETPLFIKSRVFYGFDLAKQAIRESDEVILVEGQLDVVLAHQAGTENVVGVSGTALTQEHIKIMSRSSDNLTLVLDGDEAGFRASERSVRMALAAGLYVNVVSLPPGNDPADIVRKDESEWIKLIERKQPFITYALGMLEQYKGKGQQVLTRAAHDYLYPVLSDMYNEIDKDAALQDLASMIGVSPDSIREDFKKWIQNSKTPAVKPPDAGGLTAGEHISNSILEKVLGRLWGIALAHKVPDALLRLSNTLGDDLYKSCQKKFEGSNMDDVIFQAETYHPAGQGAEAEFEVLLNRAKAEVLRDKFGKAMQELRSAESRGDADRTKGILEQCNIISKELANLPTK